MDNFFNPKTIAIIGASSKKGKVGYSLVKNLLNFKGKIFLINPNRKKILNKLCYKNVRDIKEHIDLAIIALHPFQIKDVIIDCGTKNIKNIIIISAGFSEVGNKNLEESILETAKEYRIRIIGPNTFGVVNPYISLDTTFASISPLKGNISFVSQSGALWSAISDYSKKENFGFSKFIALGNMSDINFTDCIKYLNKDPNTKVIVLYIELIKDGKKFMKISQTSKKPIIAIKAGHSQAGIKAALSHTGSLAGTYEIYKAAFKQSNIILVDTLTQALDTARFLTNNQKIGKRTIILTNAGGPGALAADYLEESSLEVQKLTESFIKKIKLDLWSKNNPIDLVGDAKSDKYKLALDSLNKNFYDNLLILLTPQNMTDSENIAKEIINFKNKTKKPVITCFMGGKSIEKSKLLLEKNNILSFTEIKRAVDVLKYSQQ